MINFIAFELPLTLILLIMATIFWIWRSPKPNAYTHLTIGKRLQLGLPFIWKNGLSVEEIVAIRPLHLKNMLLNALVFARLIAAVLLYLVTRV